MSLSTKEYFIKETFKSIKRNQLMSLASVSTVALSLLVLGFFMVMVFNTNHIAKYLETQVQISVYMADDISEEELSSTKEILKTMPGVTEIKAITKEEALERFKERLGSQSTLLDSIGEENPFPYSFELHVDAPERISQLAPRIDELEGVETAKFGQEVVENLFKLTKILRWGGALLVCLLAMATLFIIVNTIRITVFARRREVNIMKYVGATDWFIRWPFLLEGMFLGFVGALVAAIIINQIYGAILNNVHAALAFFPLLPTWPLLLYVSLSLLVIGTAIGAAGSFISLRKFLKV
ncbi:MAG TPA: ABC transporter permease [Candidatus Avacidaminococcus intestinavium]|uniref:Cell division protein FtsX n=1 Tax=Candidatus Avacidaminococcus intestinavium TaxID=2840684 RepID=A0A9D1MQ76_9FIRM|nr:ABC transporter permease [Candidatus Avacidaminococcus intestinavium]